MTSGTGAYTVLGQVAADVLGVPNEMVRVHLGDSTLPSGPMAGGSITTGSAGSAIHVRRSQVRDTLLRGGGWRGLDAGGRPRDRPGRHGSAGDRGAGDDDGRRDRGDGGLEAGSDERREDARGPGRRHGVRRAGDGANATYSFGAQFAEVRVDPLLRTVRVSRMVGVFACGRIINPRTARSNLMGGMIWGASFALLEETQIDRPRARFANTDLAGYHFSTNADIGEVMVETIDEDDTVVNPIGAKGVGEIGIVGMNAAIGNAVYHATGIRVRKTPIQVQDLLPN